MYLQEIRLLSFLNSITLANSTKKKIEQEIATAKQQKKDAEEKNKQLANRFKDLQQVSDYNSAFMNLESGMVDAICMDIGVAQFQVESRGDDYVILEERVSSEADGVGFKLGNKELRDQVQETLKEMGESTWQS